MPKLKPPKGGFIFEPKQMEKKKVIVYVDGYNFYYGLKNGAPSGNVITGLIW